MVHYSCCRSQSNRPCLWKVVVVQAPPDHRITRIHVEKGCSGLPYVQEILARLPGIPVREIPDRFRPEAPPSPPDLHKSKQELMLLKNRGRFLSSCPGTREYRCCGYQVLDIGNGCPMDCVYCILQAYLNAPYLTFYVNIEDLFAELDHHLAVDQKRFHRIGTGEFTDSMALDRVTGLSRRLIEFFAEKDSCMLELKSKAVVLDHVLSARHNGRTIMAWSVNSDQVAGKLEFFTAPVEERLEAASRCAAQGFPLAFHFDPIIRHPGWEEGYLRTVQQIFARVPAEAIAWISMGTFRCMPRLVKIIQQRFPGTTFMYDEFIPGLDNKLRYFRSVRVEMYRLLAAEIDRFRHPDTCLYLCMENDAVWKEVFGFAPEEQGGLDQMLDRAAILARQRALSLRGRGSEGVCRDG